MQKVCSVQCATEIVVTKKRVEFKRETRKRKKNLNDNDRSYQLKKCQQTFNEYIRKRDEKDPCISCGRDHQGQYHAGHYRTVGAHPELRFNELNCHKQCSVCNNHKSGNIVEYRINLARKIGEKNLEWLEGSHEVQKLSIDEIKEIRQYYKEKLRNL